MVNRVFKEPVSVFDLPPEQRNAIWPITADTLITHPETGETLTVHDWANRMGLVPRLIVQRLTEGKGIAYSLTERPGSRFVPVGWLNADALRFFRKVNPPNGITAAKFWEMYDKHRSSTQAHDSSAPTTDHTT